MAIILVAGAGVVHSGADAYGQTVPDLDSRTQHLAERQLARRYGAAAQRMQVRVRRVQGVESMPVQVRFPSSGDAPRGTIQVRVETRAGGATEGWALLYIAHFDSVMVAQHVLASNAPITVDAVAPAWVETTRFRGEPLRPSAFQALQRVGPLVAARRLRAGQALRAGDVRGPYAADTGEAVLMQYQRAGLRLRIPCTAREPGFAGDTIRLYAPSTRTMYRARLTGSGTAEWTETL